MKNIFKLFTTAFLASSLLAGTAQAGSMAAGLSNATQDLKIGNLSASTSNTGVYFDFRADSLFGQDKLGYGFLWNNATNSGSVLELYLQPKMMFNDKFGGFARVGYSLSGAGGGATATNGASFAWGLGGTYKINKSLDAEVVYDSLYSNSPWDMKAISVGVVWHK